MNTFKSVGVLLAFAVASPQAATAAWRYTTTRDAMRGIDKREACVTALTTLRLNFPYRSQKPELCVRSHPLRSGVYVNLRFPGQFTTHDWTHLSVDGAPVIFFHNSTDDTNSALFLSEQALDIPSDVANAKGADGQYDPTAVFRWKEGNPTLTDRLKASKRVIIEVEAYGAGTQQLTFDTQGLKWDAR